MTDEVWDEPGVKEWVDHVLGEMAPKMRGSAMVIQLVPDDRGDVKFWVELGASIMMDKPIIAVAFDGRQIPAKLAQIADEIVVMPDGVNPEGSEELQGAISRVMGRLDQAA